MLNSLNHDKCVMRSKMCVNQQSSATKVWRVKQVKQVWKATGKLFTTIGHQWRPTGRLLPLGDQWPLTRNTPPKVLPTKQWKPTGRLLPLGRQCPLVRSTALKSDCLPADPQETIAPVVQIVLWYLDSGCSKHMTGDRSRLRNFVKKFIGTVRFGNDHFGAIMGYGDYVIGDSVISRVYYVEGLGHNLFSVGQFCDSDLEVAFRKHTCFVRDLDGVDLIKGSRGTNLYTISVEDMMRSSPICLLSKASKNKSWLWHRRLNHLNFGTLNDLARKDLVRVDDYSRFTWVKFLRSKDETPIFVINLLKQLQDGLNKTVRFMRTDNGTEFNGIVERRNRTLVEAARTMLIFSKGPLFLWAEAVATACYTQNRSLIHTLYNKTPYELVHDKKPDLSFLSIFEGSLLPTNNIEDLGCHVLQAPTPAIPNRSISIYSPLITIAPSRSQSHHPRSSIISVKLDEYGDVLKNKTSCSERISSRRRLNFEESFARRSPGLKPIRIFLAMSATKHDSLSIWTVKNSFLIASLKKKSMRDHQKGFDDLDVQIMSTLKEKLFTGSSEGSGTTPEVPDEPKDNSAVVAEKQAGYVQTNLTLSSAELEIQSMVDVPIHQEDLAVQRTPLIDPVISMVTEKTASTPHHQPHKLMFKCVQPLAGKTFQEEFRSAGWCKENSDGQKTVAKDMGFILLVRSIPALSTLGRSGLRTASVVVKPCQGDSSEVYLITGKRCELTSEGLKHQLEEIIQNKDDLSDFLWLMISKKAQHSYIVKGTIAHRSYLAVQS
ncbi:retrovirus-related pol polyprotein from transposon TNT 1-94 [Tanacetum coccineum]